jgi:uncharacterized protein YjbI with pentapeptide repeats
LTAADLSEPVFDDGARRKTLRADCARCFGLCCVVPAFSASSDFAIDKAAGQPCAHLGSGFGCTIHADLRQRGFPGCTVYDCFGAGQKVAQQTFGGHSWRQSPPEVADQMFRVFTVMRQLHELLWYLSAALTLPAARPLYPQLRGLFAETERFTESAPDDLAQLDVEQHRVRVNVSLTQTSELVRAGSSRRGANRRGADLIGKDLRATDLRGANLRGAQLVGADLRGVDLSLTDLIGADLRGADLSGADLSASIFVTQAQIDAARGDASTSLPAALRHPGHWRL